MIDASYDLSYKRIREGIKRAVFKVVIFKDAPKNGREFPFLHYQRPDLSVGVVENTPLCPERILTIIVNALHNPAKSIWTFIVYHNLAEVVKKAAKKGNLFKFLAPARSDMASCNCSSYGMTPHQLLNNTEALMLHPC